ncbi:hypothetical protein [Flavipsychrobacter stenotrophus]|nr:hypothetical protein [Flavipsychrobacter stenotrophus]
MKRMLLTIWLLTYFLSASGQLETTPLFPGNNDSLFLKNLISFNSDSAGNYSMFYKYMIEDRGMVYELKRVYASEKGQYVLSDTFNYYEEQDQLQIFGDTRNKKYHCKF